MKDKEKSLEELHLIFTKIDAKLEQAEKDLKLVKDFLKEYKAIQKNIKELESYYHSDWLKDRTALCKQVKDKNYLSCSEDAIWNMSQEHYEQKIKLLKRVAKNL